MTITVELNLTKEVFKKAVRRYVEDWECNMTDLTRFLVLDAIVETYFDTEDENITSAIIPSLTQNVIDEICEKFAFEYSQYLKEQISKRINGEGSEE